MTIIVEVGPEVRAELARQAAARGHALEVYAASLLEDAAHVPANLHGHDESCAAKASNLMDLFEPVRGLLSDEEVDTLFTRNPSTGRPLDLE
jgi:hypothetical protein